jgi:uncharacterized membrane protein
MVLAISGPQRVRNATNAARNVGDIERVVSAVGGAAIAAAAVKRGGVGGVALALIGAELIRRAATGRCMLYEALGVSTAGDGHAGSTRRPPHDLASNAATVDARESVKVEYAVTIADEPQRLYAYWRDFTNHPRFMKYLESVRLLDDQHSHWTWALPSGHRLEWDSEIVNDIPNQLIAWKTLGAADLANAGSVHFRTAPAGRGTEVRAVMDYEPIGGRPGHFVAKLLGIAPEQMLREDLHRFKQLMETGDVLSNAGQTSAR